MRRGEILLADLEPVRGSEANKRRPVIIVSNDGANEAASRDGRGVVTIVPITSNVSRIFGFQVFLDSSTTGLAHDSKAQAEQVRALDCTRLGRRLGTVPPPEMTALDEALRLHLAL